MVRQLALVDRPEQIGEVPQDCIKIATSPLVEVYDGTCLRPEDYYCEAELVAGGIENFDRVDELCSRIDGALYEELQVVRDYELKVAAFNYYYLKCLYDAFYIRVFQLQHILGAEKPERIFVFKSPQPNIAAQWWHPHESLYFAILKEVAPSLGIELIELSSASSIADMPNEGRNVNQRQVGIWEKLRHIADSSTMVAESSGLAGKTVLCLDKGYGVAPIVDELAGRGADVWFWLDNHKPVRFHKRAGDLYIALALRFRDRLKRDGSIAANLVVSQQWENICTRLNMGEYWCWDGWDIWGEVKFRMQRLIDVCLPEASQYSVWAHKILDQLRPDALLVSNLVDARRQAIVNVARRDNIPVVLTHHGSLGQSHIPILVYQSKPADLYLCYGEGVATYLRKHIHGDSYFESTGSPGIEVAVKKTMDRPKVRSLLGLSIDRPVILYAVNAMTGNHRYISNQNTSDCIQFYEQKAVTTVLAKHTGYDVIIKDHPSSPYSPLKVWLEGQRAGHIAIVDEPGIKDIAGLADIVILNNPTTTLLEVLHFNCAVYVYNSYFAWEPGAKELLENEAYIAADIDEFCTRLDLDLGKGMFFRSDSDESEFLNRFCNYMPDASASERAAIAIGSFVDNTRNRSMVLN